MNNLISLVVSVWVNLKTCAGKVANFVTNFGDAIAEYGSISKANECLRRTRNAYLAISNCTVRNLITARTLDKIVHECKTYAEITESIGKTCAGDDSLYCILLVLAIEEVYKPRTTPIITGSSLPRLK